MSLLVYLDNALIQDEPEGLLDLKSSYSRESRTKGLVLSQDSQLTFTGDGYDYIYGVFNNGLCNEIDIKIYETGECEVLVSSGIIKISDIKIDFQQCSVSVKVEDDNFASYINNNKSIKVHLYEGEQTKSGEPLTVLQPYLMSPFLPCFGRAGLPLSNIKPGFLLFDVVQYVLDYITDNRVTLQSDLLSGNAGEPQLFVSTGLVLKTENLSDFEGAKVSFRDLYEFIQKEYNAGFVFEKPEGSEIRSILRIEKQDYLYENDPTTPEDDIVLEDVKDLKISIEEDEIYSSIATGGADTDGAVIINSDCSVSPLSGVHTIINDDLYGWEEAQFHISGQCNQDNELNLTHRFQIASNVIEEVMFGLATDFDSDIFMIEVENVDTLNAYCDAVEYDFYGVGTTPYYYNLNLNNSNNIIRWGGFLHNSVTQFYNSGPGQVKAGLSGAYTVRSDQPGIQIKSPATNPNQRFNLVQPVPYVDVTSPGYYNNGGYYSVGTGIYTIPQDGNYSFDNYMLWTPFGMTYDAIQAAWSYVQVYWGVVNLGKQEFVTNQTAQWQQNGQTFGGSSPMQMYCETGDTVVSFAYVNLWIVNQPAPFNPQLPPWGIHISTSSYFTCTSSPLAEGDLIAMNTDEYRARLYEFEYPLQGENWRKILNNPRQLITFTSNNETFRGWIDDVKYNHWSGNAEIILKSNALI